MEIRRELTIQEALEKLTALGHVIERRANPRVRNGHQYFRIDGQFRSERQILDYLITGKSLLTPFELEQGHKTLENEQANRERTFHPKA